MVGRVNINTYRYKMTSERLGEGVMALTISDGIILPGKTRNDITSL